MLESEQAEQRMLQTEKIELKEYYRLNRQNESYVIERTDRMKGKLEIDQKKRNACYTMNRTK